MKLPAYSAHASHWKLDEEMVFLNHGSFGATPTAILEKQRELQLKAESELVRFYVRELYGLYMTSLERTAKFIGAKAHNLVFIKNTTMGVNTIFHSLRLHEGDEVLSHSHAYGACSNALNYYAERNKWKVNIAQVPFPIQHEDEVVEAFVKAVTPKTKFAMVDHITSATGVIFPVERIVKELQARGIEVMVDAAHSPGHVELNLEQLGAEYFIGNCHKWICSPKGSAILYVREDKQKGIEPLQISHNFDAPVDEKQKWQGKFFWPGTDDYTAYCLVGDSIDYFENNFEGGWKGIRQRNRNLCLTARKMLAEKTHSELPAPESMIGNLSNIYLGKAQLPPYGFNYITEVGQKLFNDYKIEIPTFVFNRNEPRLWVRPAFQLYNSLEQYEYLGDALVEILKMK